jgi:putative membrane protein
MKHTPQQFAVWALAGLAFALAAVPVKAQSNGGNGAAMEAEIQSQALWPGSKVNTYDRNFLVQAAADEMFELQMSQLAAEKASAPDLKAFAVKLVDQHMAVQKELEALAQAKGVILPTRLGALRQREFYSMERMTGEDFDRAYFQRVVLRAHRQDVRLFRDASRMARDVDVRAWAGKMMPAQEQHVADARALPSARRLTLTPFDPNANQGGGN